MIARFLAAIFLSVACTAWAQPLTIITSSGAGSLSDTAARSVQPLLEKELGRPVVVINMAGAQGLIAMRHFAKLPADGSSLFIGGTQIPFIAKNKPQGDFDPMAELEPLHGLAYTPQQIMVASTSPAKTVYDLADVLKRKGMLTGASSHPSTQTSMAMLDKVIGIKTTVVPYKEATNVASDVAGGFVDYTIGGKGNGSTAGMVESGHLRVIGMLKDYGVEEFSWNAFFIQASAPDDVKRHLVAALAKVMRTPHIEKFHQERFLADTAAIRKLMKREFDLLPSP